MISGTGLHGINPIVQGLLVIRCETMYEAPDNMQPTNQRVLFPITKTSMSDTLYQPYVHWSLLDSNGFYLQVD